MKTSNLESGYERIETKVYADSLTASKSIAQEIAALIRQRNAEGRKTVLGLATGSTPVPLYRELIRLHVEEGLSFVSVVTFNLDEYYPLSSDHPESYNRFMKEQLFNHIDIPDTQTNIPNGSVSRDEAHEECANYESRIEKAGGIDIQILGIGRTGHIGFNEPGSGPSSKTRLVTLDRLTRQDAARDFHGERNVPRYAMTMGVGTILGARKIYLLAWGRSKAEVVRKAIEEAPSDSLPASYLQQHANACFCLNLSSAANLTRYNSPWLVGFPEWTKELSRKAVVDLSLKLGKPLLKLVDKDYQENGLSELDTEQGPAYGLNIRIFNEVQHTITGWPGGKPNTDDAARPERAEPGKKRSLILSPEPLDDVSNMAGTLSRLVAHGHEVTVAYLTSGNLGVPDEDATRSMQFMEEVGLTEKPSIKKLKSYIRRNEARAALIKCGLDLSRIRFLDLPFYEAGSYRQFVTAEDDVQIIVDLLDEIKPHQVFVTGESSDPSSVQAKSFHVFEKAYRSFSGESWIADCYVWLYRSDGLEWDVFQTDMAVPCSPDELDLKAQAIALHQSQRSQASISDDGHAEPWRQAIARNRSTADLYDALGLAEYEAVECFVRWKGREEK